MSASETPVEKPAKPAVRRRHWLSVFIKRFATPLTAGLFAVSAVSGVALFFHWAPGTFHTMHVRLSMVLLAPFAFHVWKNWSALLGYVRRGTLVAPLFACLVVAVPFAFSGVTEGDRGENPGRRVTELLIHARLSDLAPVLKTTPGALSATLVQLGYRVQSSNETLSDVAAASGKEPSQALVGVMRAGR